MVLYSRERYRSAPEPSLYKCIAEYNHFETRRSNQRLLHDLCHQTCRNSPTPFSDIESLTGFQSDGIVELADHLDIVTWHHHLGFFVRSIFGPVERGGLVYSDISSAYAWICRAWAYRLFGGRSVADSCRGTRCVVHLLLWSRHTSRP